MQRLDAAFSAWKNRGGLLVVGGVFFGEGFQVFREIVNGVNGIEIAGWDARAAVGALIRIDKKLGDFRELRFILSRVDAIDGASFDAVLVLGAGVRDYECHLEKPSRRQGSNRGANRFGREVAEFAGISELKKVENRNRTNLGCVGSHSIMGTSQHQCAEIMQFYAVAGLG
ncbi:MAG TPA: hypothetical protein VI431_05365 [Candidatus Acidoferrum sp.]